MRQLRRTPRRPLLLRPGVLTRGYLAGRRSRYLAPLQLYLLVSLVFFLALPHTGLFRYDLEQFRNYSIFGAVPEQLISQRLATTQEPLVRTAALFAGLNLLGALVVREGLFFVTLLLV